MCKDCLIEVKPEVDTHTTDSGANMLNFKACAACGKKGFLKSNVIKHDLDGGDEDEDMTIEELHYQHLCAMCGHVVAEHFYTYTQDDEEQEFNMECLLCGRGGKSVVFADMFDGLSAEPKENITGGDDDLRMPEIPAVVEVKVSFNDEGLSKRLAAQQDDEKKNAQDDDEWD